LDFGTVDPLKTKSVCFFLAIDPIVKPNRIAHVLFIIYDFMKAMAEENVGDYVVTIGTLGLSAVDWLKCKKLGL